MPGHLKTDVFIAGAGLTGLTLAYYLKKAGLGVILADKAERPGGVIGTVSEDGFVYETGPNTGILSTPEIVELFGDLAPLTSPELPAPASKSRWIWKNGKWHALPSGLGTAITTPLFSLYDKFRILGEPFRKAGNNPDESVADLVRRRMGKSFLTFAVDPFISGIYAGDPERLITRYALPKLYNLEQEYGSFIRGAIKKKSLPKSEQEKKVTREVFSVKGGLENLIKALVQETGPENILLNAVATEIHLSGNLYRTSITDNNGRETIVESAWAVAATGSRALPRLLPFLAENMLYPLNDLAYARVVQVAVGYKQWKGIPLNAFGGLVPSAGNRQVLGILFPSSLFSRRAPEGGALLSVFLGGMKRPDIIDMSDGQIRDIVLEEIREMLQTPVEKPDLLRIFRYRDAIPQYEITTGRRLEAIEAIEKQNPGLVLAGNIRDGIGMADRVKQGRQIADMIIQNQ